MRTLISIVILLISFNQLIGQNWNSPIQTFGIDQNAKISSFVDGRGIHISYISAGNLKYALLKSNGQIVKVNKTVFSNNCSNSVIVTNGETIFVLFKYGNTIKLAKSINLGDNWSIDDVITDVNYTMGDYLDAVLVKSIQDEKIYFVLDDITNYNSYLYSYSIIGKTKSFLDKVNLDNEPGRFPSIARSTNRLHILYFASTNAIGDVKVRDFDLNANSFYPPTQVPRINSIINPPVWGGRHYITTNNNRVHIVYTSYVSTWSNVYEYVGHFSRGVNDTIWTEHYFNCESKKELPSLLTSTNDNTIHLIYYDKTNGYLHKKFNGQSWFTVGYVYYSANATLRPNSNDLYLLSVSQNTIGNPDPYSVYLRQYDAAPLAPTNLSVSANSGIPKLRWTLNNEPDVRVNNNAYSIERRLDLMGNGQWNNWQLIGTVNGKNNEFIDTSINSAGSGPSYAQYRVRAQDIGGNYSGYSSPVTINYGNGLEKRVIKNSNFQLIGNYPNPFNPETKIVFTTPEPGSVELILYNFIGEMVYKTSNLSLDAGEHYYTINADELGLKSGIYFYNVKFKGSSKSGKMILIK
ncbi:MAG: T9SS type A sorting domain-containing protein [Ignavibacteria bacterium]|jgi:hypothetical protein|nr:T9SS type A sorting domain-containing protein [Ignavibacteria bacterium]MDH7526796.1 T9SS type A sorting domain-containing protein [Ignavibacteria bacterium]